MQGEGGGTGRKQELLAILFGQSLGITMSLPWDYWHIDLNAGCGWNKGACCPGSPIMFALEAAKVKKRCRAFFCDSNLASIEELRVRMAELTPENMDVRYLTCDNAESLQVFAQVIRAHERRPEWALGTCLCDPNGWKGLPLDALAEFFGFFKRIDAILNLNASLWAMFRGCKESNHTNTKRHHDKPDLEGVVARLSKEHWYISNPRGSGGMRFVTLIGRNMEIGKHQFSDFYNLKSAKGQAILFGLRKVQDDARFFPFMENDR